MSSISKILIILSLLAPACLFGAEPAEDYFHDGAKWYIFGDTKKARTAVDTGLTNYPGDPKLLKLDALLKQEQQQNSQQSKDEQKDQSKKDEQSKEDKSKQQEQNKSDEQKSQQEQNQDKDKQEKKPEENQAEKKPESSKDQNKPGENAKQSKDNRQEKPDGEEQAQAGKAVFGRMTQSEAQRLLDTQKADEKAMIFVPKFIKTNRTDRAFKDW
jgi:Ca-activated chloride channel family protein